MRTLVRLLVLAAALTVALVAAVRMGAVPLSVAEIAAALTGRGEPAAVAIVRELRLPRSVLAALVGAALATSGATFQALLRNPLAEPYILGVSGGAAVGAVAAIVLGVAAAGWVLPVAAFGGALVAIALVLRIALSVGRALDTRILLLAGVVVGAFFNACILLALTFADTESFRSAVFWMMGSFSGATWTQSGALTLYLVPGLLVLFALARPLDLLAIGEETATHLGVRVEATKYLAYGMASLLAAASVAVAGVIGFVGLIIPHFVRLLWEPGHRFLLPASALLGAAFLVLTDALARSVAAPTELPVGVLTAFVGVPFFVWVLRTSGRRQGVGAETAQRAAAAGAAPWPPPVIPSAARDLHLAAGTAPKVQIPRCARDDKGMAGDDKGMAGDEQGVAGDEQGVARADKGLARDDKGVARNHQDPIALAAAHLTFRYPGAERDTVRDVCFEAPAGRCTAVLGPNGSGKSTLLRLLLGTLPPHRGVARYQGRDVRDWSRADLARRVAVVQQQEEIAFPLTVRDLVALGRYPYLGNWRREGPVDRAAIHRAMEICDVADLEGRAVQTLSGGERQRVRIARALAQEPELLALDEPTVALDVRHEMAIFELLRELASRGVTILMVTHNLNLAARYADRLVVLDRGEIAAAGPPERVLTRDMVERVYRWPVRVAPHPGPGPDAGAPQVTPLSGLPAAADAAPEALRRVDTDIVTRVTHGSAPAPGGPAGPGLTPPPSRPLFDTRTRHTAP